MMNQARVGVTVLLMQGQQLLLAKRAGSHGAGTWDTPGGHLELGERVFDCALRETFEETGMQLDASTLTELGFTEDFFDTEGKHYISCVVACNINDTTCKPVVREKNKFSTEWVWCELNALPEPLFISVKNALDKFIARGE